VRVWRIVKEKRVATAYDGQGARGEPGRWHDGDRAMVYASESIALATLEMLAKTRMFEGLRGRVVVPADIPDDAVARARGLPDDWKQFPHPGSTRAYGNGWFDAGTLLALIVPSVVVPGDNILLNPNHPRWNEIRIGPPVTDAFDPRLTE
jgi:RES domain-containing protein